MHITLTQIGAAFDALGDDEQIQLVEYLADRMACGEGVDLRECAREYADHNLEFTSLPDGSFDCREAEYEALVDSLAYSPRWAPSVIARHKEVRDAQLERALTRSVRRAA